MRGKTEAQIARMVRSLKPTSRSVAFTYTRNSGQNLIIELTDEQLTALKDPIFKVRQEEALARQVALVKGA